MSSSQKLNDQDIANIKMALSKGERIVDIARRFGVTPPAICQIKSGIRKPNGKDIDKGVFLTVEEAEDLWPIIVKGHKSDPDTFGLAPFARVMQKFIIQLNLAQEARSTNQERRPNDR